MLQSEFTSKFKFTLIALWLLFTVSLSAWWLIFSLKQQEVILQVGHNEFVKHQTMLLMEGATLIASLLAGGLALAYLSFQQHKKNQEVKDFFATFSHELKTSITSLRIQAESLQEDLAKTEHGKLLDRLMKDTVRLELQLENSLFLAAPNRKQFFIETISFTNFLKNLEHQWPSLKLNLIAEINLKCDRRALESIVKNILQNAVVHGKATEVCFKAKKVNEKLIELEVEDNGIGYQGRSSGGASGSSGQGGSKSFPLTLGELFHRQSNSSGSAIGLALIKQLVLDHGGNIEFLPDKHFKIIMSLPGELVFEKKSGKGFES